MGDQLVVLLVGGTIRGVMIVQNKTLAEIDAMVVSSWAANLARPDAVVFIGNVLYKRELNHNLMDSAQTPYIGNSGCIAASL